MIPGLAGIDSTLVGTAIAAVLTVSIFSYLLGDLPGVGGLFKFFYRLALHILVGAGVAYALLVAGWGVLYPYVFVRLMQFSVDHDIAQLTIALLGTGLGILLLLKGIRSLAWLGNIATGYLIGVGLGVAAGGAVLGTLYAQSVSTATLSGARTNNSLWLIVDSVILVLGTLTVLLSFTFTATITAAFTKTITATIAITNGPDSSRQNASSITTHLASPPCHATSATKNLVSA